MVDFTTSLPRGRGITATVPMLFAAAVHAVAATSTAPRLFSTCNGFDVYNNTDCDDGTHIATATTPDPLACCAACSALAACRSWSWQPAASAADAGSSVGPSGGGRCNMNTHPGSYSAHEGGVCGIAADTPPNATYLACMDVHFNASLDGGGGGDLYRALLTDTSNDCCAACATDARVCVSWKWTQLAAIPAALLPAQGDNNDDGENDGEGSGTDSAAAAAATTAAAAAAATSGDEWTNCELHVRPAGQLKNETHRVISGKMKGASPTPSPPAPGPPPGPGGYVGCFADLLNGAAGRDLPFFLCSNGTDPTPMSGASFCAPDPRLPPAIAGAASTELPSANAGGSRMSPALCASLCGTCV